MNIMALPSGPSKSQQRQRGSVLFLVIMLLLLASILTLFALNVGVFEQRLSGNDMRAKYTQQLADSAIAEGVEHIRLQGAEFTAFGAVNWNRCSVDDLTFPCGALPVERRGDMFFFSNGGGDPLESRMLLPYDQARFQDVGGIAGNGFPVEYGAGAAICWISRGSVDEVACATEPDDASNVFVLTMVGVARMPGEAARATATQTLGAYTLFDNLPELPPIIAAGTVTLRGSIDVVANPNAAGPGVPVSIWTRSPVDPNGTPNTCYIDEFFREGAPNAANQGPTFYPDTTFVTCRGCSCPDNKSLSFGGAGPNSCPGIDILAPTKTRSAGCTNEAANDIDPSNPRDFPCDLFEYVFGIRAWDDVNPVDNFCETKVFVDNRLDDSDTTEVGADVAFLVDSAQHILAPADSPLLAALGLAGDPRVRGCDGLGNLSGLVWMMGCTNIPANTDVGTPETPIVLVVDGGQELRFNASTRLFGVLFGRHASLECDFRAKGGPDCTIGSATGGNASVRMNGGSQLYGTAIMQGEMHGSGTNAVIYNADVLRTIVNNPDNFVFNSLPGSWTDLVRY